MAVKQANPKKVVKADPDVQLYELARRWAQLWRREKAVEADRGAAARPLIRRMKRKGMTNVQIGRRLVQLVTGKKKRVSKGDVSNFFGLEPANRFWNNVPDSVFEYLTLVEKKR